MKTHYLLFISAVLISSFTACKQSTAAEPKGSFQAKSEHQIRGFETKVAWGDHLVNTIGCDDCHTPKKMTSNGPVVDENRKLMGHPSGNPYPDIDRALFEKNGYIATGGDLTAWVGPWGISYSANLTPHETGIGNWTEEQFKNSLRHGWYKGMEGGRMLLPPMPWFNFAKLTDPEISAMFAYLKSLKPIDNLVPSPQPPVSSTRKTS